ncbi:MAG: hypothetical protein VYB54_14750 [Pseudomonadota bacterium]|nr:hypothetical protein [Pseudomonadota bacterium]
MNGTTGAPPAEDRTLCGWRVRSEIALPEALPWRGPADHPVDVNVALGPVPGSLPDAVSTERQASVDPAGRYLLTIRNAGRYLVTGGNRIVVDRTCPPDWPDARLFIETNCLAALGLQRGYLPLHAAVVQVHGRVIAIMGVAGQGKSTLAATLALRGHRFLAEDVGMLQLPAKHGRARPVVIPSLPNVRLLESALVALGIEPESLQRSRRRMRKYHLVRPDLFHEQPATLDAMVFLANTSDDGAVGVAAVNQIERVADVIRMILRPKLALQLGFEHPSIAMAMHMLGERRVFRLSVRRDLSRLHDNAALIEQLALSLPG